MTCQFETPFFVPYSYIPAFSLCLFLGFLIFFKDRKNKLNQYASGIIFLIAFWIGVDFMQWTLHSVKWNLFFARISFFSDFIYLLFLYLAYQFIYGSISLKRKILLAVPFLVEIPFMFTNASERIFNASICEFVDGNLIFYSYFIVFGYTFWASKILVEGKSVKGISIERKNQINIFLLAIWFFAIMANVFQEIWRVSILAESAMDITPYFIFWNLIFVFLMVLSMAKTHLFKFNIRVAKWLVFFSWAIIFFSLFFFYFDLTFFLLAIVIFSILGWVFWEM